MKTVKQLKQEIRQAMKFRGHVPEYKFQTYVKDNWYGISCLKCGCEAQLHVNPLPNQINIEGTAIGLNCD